MKSYREFRPFTVLSRRSRTQILALAAASAVCAASHADDVFKLDNADALNAGTAWSTNLAPTALDVAVWDSGITSGPLTNALGADATWGGMRIGSPAGLVTISAGNVLTLGGSGIDMSAASQNLTIDATVATLVGSRQTWNVNTGQTLTITPAITRGARSTIDFTGGGDVVLNGNTATSLLPWATVNGNTDIAALNASKQVRGATTVFTYVAPNGGNVSGTIVGVNVSQPTTFGSTQAYRHSNSLTTTNGVRFNEDNAGAALWTVDTSSSGRVNTTPVILISPNVTQEIQYNGSGGVRAFSSGGELVIAHHGSGNLIFNTTINGNGTSSLLKLGPGQLTVASNSGYTGQTNLMQGTLQLGNGGTTGGLASSTILLNDTTVNFNRSDAAGAYAGVITGTGELNFISPSTGAYALTNAANSFTGPVNVTGGGLIINNIGNIPATATINLNNGSLVHAAASSADISARTVTLVGSATIDTGANNVTYANGIGGGGSGGLTKVGSGILTLAGASTYTGGTTVNAGTLRVSNTTGSHPGNVLVNANATLGGTGTISGTTTVTNNAILSPGASIGTLYTGSLDLQSGAKANWEFAGGNYDKVVVTESGGLTMNGGAFTLFNENTVDPFSSVGDYDLIQYTGAVNGGTSSLSVANPQPGKSYAFSLTGGFVRLSITTSGVVSQWITDGGGSFSVAGNWSPATVPDEVGATANFTTNLSNPATVTLDGSRTMGAIVFQSSPNGYTLAQGTGGTLNLNNGTALGAMSVLSGNHTISAPVALSGNTQVSAVADSSLTLSGVVSGAVNISKNGPGTLVMTGSNSFSDGVFLNDGTLAIGNNNALGTGITTMSTTGSLRADADVTIPNQIVTNGGLTGVIDTQTFTVQLNNEVNGGGELIKAGNGTLIINSNNNAPNNVISAGTMQIGTGGVTGAVSSSINNNAVVVLNRSDDLTFGNNMSGTGTFIKKAANTATLSFSNTYSGDTQIAGGTLALGHPLAIQNSTLDYNAYGGVLNFGNETAPTFGGLKGSQDLDLTNAVAAPVALSVGSNGVSTSYSGVLSGTGSALTKIGAGTLTLSNVQTYTGSTTLSGGVLELATGASLTPSTVVMPAGSGGATFLITGGSYAHTGTFTQNNQNTVRVTAGTFGADGYTQNLQNNNNNALLRVDGGVANIGSFLSDRSGININNGAEPAAGVDTTGIYTTGGTLSFSGTVGIGYDWGANTSQNMRIDGGVVNMAGTTTITLNNGGRWSVMDVNGGTLNITDTTTGLVFGGGGSTTINTFNLHTAGNNILIVRNGVANIEKIQMGAFDQVGTTSATDTTPFTYGYTGTQVIGIYGGALYVGAGGIKDIQETGVGTETLRTTNIIRLGTATTGGILGANADWSSRQNIDLRNNTGVSIIQAADAAGTAHNITLSGVASGTGGFNKTGAGTVTMTGLNTYAGNTTVTQGTLLLGPVAHGPILTGAGAVLNGGKLVMDYTGGSSPQGVIVPELVTNAPTGFQAGKARTSLAADASKAVGWLDDGTSTFQARYTHKGDIDLSGVVDSVDFNAFIAGYGMTSGAIWANGDTDYDGKVNTIDFNYLAGNFGAAPIPGALPGSPAAPSLGSVVPEPSTFGLLAIAATGMIARRRRQV